MKLTTHLLYLRYHLIQVDCRLFEQVIKRNLFRLQNASQFHRLTSREVEVLQLLASGLNNPKIARKLSISRSTVETHRKHLKRKLELQSFWDLMKYALAYDLIQY